MHQEQFGIYIIGDEILSGKRQDAHLSNLLFELLSARGLQLSWANYLGDIPERNHRLAQSEYGAGRYCF